MTFNSFKQIFDKVPDILTQIAFGIGDIDGNSDLWRIMDYCKQHNVIPNITINGTRMTEKILDNLVEYCGAVAVSHYKDNNCFNVVERLVQKGLKQVNIHKLVARETLRSCYNLIDASLEDKRLEKLNAIVFLGLKIKGERNTFHIMDFEDWSELIQYALNKEVSIGFDSCSAHKFLKVVKNHPDYERFKLLSEPCESSCFSLYVNVDGIAYPCSFLEDEEGYVGIDVLNINDFLQDVWYNEELQKFRKKLIEGKRKCPHFKI